LLGPAVALIPPLLLGAFAWFVLRATEGRIGGIVGLGAGVVAAPGLLVAGAPFGDQDTYGLAVLASVPLWMVIGVLASRRATRSPMASWRDFWREYSWLAVAVAAGALGGLTVAAAVLGESLW
jgi:hypothetical protein